MDIVFLFCLCVYGRRSTLSLLMDVRTYIIMRLSRREFFINLNISTAEHFFHVFFSIASEKYIKLRAPAIWKIKLLFFRFSNIHFIALFRFRFSIYLFLYLICLKITTTKIAIQMTVYVFTKTVKRGSLISLSSSKVSYF